jgi:hypothetical protein
MSTAELSEFARGVAGRRALPTPLPQIPRGVQVFEAALRAAVTVLPVRVG